MKFLTQKNVRTILIIFVASLGYAMLRYHIFKGVEWAHFPLYTLNKAFSLTGLILIALSYASGKLRGRRKRNGEELLNRKKSFAFIGFILIGAHIIASLTILHAGYFPKFYDGTMMNLTGESTMLFGLISVIFFLIPAIASLPDMIDKIGEKRWKKMQRIGYYGLVAASIHVLIMGWSGWFTISEWPGSLPPITLISFIFGAAPVLLLLLTSKN